MSSTKGNYFSIRLLLKLQKLRFTSSWLELWPVLDKTKPLQQLTCIIRIFEMIWTIYFFFLKLSLPSGQTTPFTLRLMFIKRQIMTASSLEVVPSTGHYFVLSVQILLSLIRLTIKTTQVICRRQTFSKIIVPLPLSDIQSRHSNAIIIELSIRPIFILLESNRSLLPSNSNKSRENSQSNNNTPYESRIIIRIKWTIGT